MNSRILSKDVIAVLGASLLLQTQESNGLYGRIRYVEQDSSLQVKWHKNKKVELLVTPKKEASCLRNSISR
jgi:hypothetical protein